MKTANGIETFDMATGQLLAVQKDETVPEDLFVEHEIDGQKVMIQNTVKYVPQKRYNPVLCDIIAQKIVEGVPMSEICKEPGMPSLHLIARWRKVYPEFNEAIEFARRARAELMRDRALEIAQSSPDKDEVAAAKMAVDALKWAAEKDDPEVYGNRTKVEGTIGVVQLVVETGIRRSELASKDVIEVDKSDDS